MELVQCIRNVYATTAEFPVERTDRVLFIKGHVYPVFEESPYWLAQDEEGEKHIISDCGETLENDEWFKSHFRAL
jgi:hypothetical protein